jgi:protoheme IX farnesyltransferase
MIRQYYLLAKPGIIYGNLITTVAAFLFASRWHFSPLFFLATVVGVGLVIGSGCVFNNYIDRDIDGKMARTRDRALVLGSISSHDAIAYGILLGILGFFLLISSVNILTAAVVLFGLIFYVFFYTVSKRISHWGTVVGSISGAVPIVAGYTAVTNTLDSVSFVLFLILILWQMPHFYAIAIYRLEDYMNAGIPVLPAQKGLKMTKVYIVCYVIAFIAAASSLTILGHAGFMYLAVVLLFGLSWLLRALEGFKTMDDGAWARKLFLFSIVVMVTFSIALSVAPLVP